MFTRKHAWLCRYTPGIVKTRPTIFVRAGHSNDDMIVSVLKGNLVNLRERRRTELELIRLFKTKSNGLNIDISFLSHYNVNDY